MRTFILIVSYGRTGSTLLRELLNTDSNANIQGENEGAFIPLAQFYKKAHIALNKAQNGKTTSPWDTYVNIDEITSTIRHLIECGFFAEYENLTNKNIIGFKDVSYRFISPQIINDLFSMLNDLYDLKIVFNFRRDRQALISSMLRAGMIDGRFTELEAIVQFETLERMEQTCNYSSFRIDYEDLFLFRKLEKLFKFCNLNFDKEACETLFKILYSNNHHPKRLK